MMFVLERRVQCRLLRCAMEERRAFSEGERTEEGDEWSAVRRGEGWPERERRISWSILGDVVYFESPLIGFQWMGKGRGLTEEDLGVPCPC